MRVGAFLGDFTPDVGGGFTFQQDLLNGILAQAGDSRHEFVLLVNSGANANRLQTYSLPRNVNVAVLARESNADRWIQAAKIYSPLFRRLVGKAGRIERAARQLGLECLWYVGGGCYEATDTPYIATVWDLTHRQQPWFPEVSAHGMWQAREQSHGEFLQRAACVIAGTQTGRDEIGLFYQIPEERIRILPHPTPSFALSGAAGSGDVRTRFGLGESFLIYPAQFWPHKNHANLLRALRIAEERHGVVVDLVLVGSDKGNEGYVRSLADRLNLRQRVHFLGFVSQTDLLGLYRAARGMVYPSFCGPENLPPLEAFATGCAVAAARIPGSVEQLGDCALLFDPASPEDMAEKIYTLLGNHSLRNELRQRAISRATSWTATDFVNGVVKILDEFEPVRWSWETA
jgi:glycosyltransferase involved in cell wall biosynthesis